MTAQEIKDQKRITLKQIDEKLSKGKINKSQATKMRKLTYEKERIELRNIQE